MTGGFTTVKEEVSLGKLRFCDELYDEQTNKWFKLPHGMAPRRIKLYGPVVSLPWLPSKPAGSAGGRKKTAPAKRRAGKAAPASSRAAQFIAISSESSS